MISFNVIELALQSDPLKTYLVVPWYMEKYLNLLNLRYDQLSGDEKMCFNVKPGTHIYWSILDDGLRGENFQRLDYVFQKLVGGACKMRNQSSTAADYGSAEMRNRKLAVFINRKGTRELSADVFKAIDDVLVAEKDWQVKYFYGNESTDETICLFSKANFIFGFHGAGFVNAYFSTVPAVVVFEMSFYDEKQDKVWRFNSWELASAKKMTVVPYMLNPDQYLGPGSAEKGQGLKHVLLNRTDIFNIQQYVRLAIRGQQYTLRSLTMPTKF